MNEETNKRLTIVSILILLAVVVMTVFLLIFRPGQFDAEIKDTVGKVAAQRSDLTLVILSDVHYDPSKYNSETGEIDILQPTMNAIKEIRKKLEKEEHHIDAFWNLGDFINGHDTTKEKATLQIKTVIKEQEKVSDNFHNLMGNHDNNIQSTWGDSPLSTSNILSVSELNEILENRATTQAEQHNPSRPTDYFVDFETIRVVCLSAEYTTFVPETVEWLRTTVLNTDKAVLFLSHIPTRPEWGFKDDVENGNLIEEVLEEFVEKGGSIIAFIHGHDHGDMINEVLSSDGSVLWSEICVGCARFQEPKSNGTPGMTFWPRQAEDETELLFDVVSIDLEKKEVRFVRFGAGEDRKIEYE